MKKRRLAVQQQMIPGYTGQAFSYGNKKLPQNVLIANISSATNCPSRLLGLCKVSDICYALHDEKRWPNCKNKNLTIENWMQNASEQDVTKLLEVYIDEAPIKVKYLRLNEAGDFLSQDNVDMWDRIADHIFSTRGITTTAYTARADLDFSGVKHIVINASLPNTKGATREFRCTPKSIFDNLKVGKGEYKCPGKCDKCQVCYDNKFKGIIYCRRH